MDSAQRVVLVSNRLPPAEDLIGDDDVASRQVSGLVSALRPALGPTESLWFGWSGRTSTGQRRLGDRFGLRVPDVSSRSTCRGATPACSTTHSPTARCGRCCTTSRTGSSSGRSRTRRTGGSTAGSPRTCCRTCGRATRCGSTTSTCSRSAPCSGSSGGDGKDRLLPARPVPIRRHLLHPPVGAGPSGRPARLRPRGAADPQPRPQPDAYAGGGASRRADRRRLRVRVEAMPRRRLPGRYRP